MASRRHVFLTGLRLVLRRQPQRSLADSVPQTTSRFGALDAKIQQALPPRLQGLWNHPAGLKTIHFWAPAFKWCLVIAGIADYARPPEKLSVRQSGALAATGVIWARYSMVIIPVNWNLFSVNFFLGLTGLMQLGRIYLYYQSQGKEVKEEKPAEAVAAEVA
ncbi:uncharacterized protein [Diadema antillarum]|uniref:uncharacterized protein n=1 Tax=Diadema antillarum TaxID=105358 RepID=UPI003A8BF538